MTKANGSVESFKHVREVVVLVYRSFVKDIIDYSDSVKLTEESDVKANALKKEKIHARTTQELHFQPQQLNQCLSSFNNWEWRYKF